MWIPSKTHTATFSVETVGEELLNILGTTEQASVCRGDADGPVFNVTNSGIKLHAINSTSWQHGCFGEITTNRGATASRIDDIRGWISTNLIDLAATPAPKHAINLNWIPQPDAAKYLVYGSATAEVALEQGNLIGSTTENAFVHTALPARQTWYYRVVPVVGDGTHAPASGTASATTAQPTETDFNGDGKDDIATFLRGDKADVYVSLSDSTKFIDNDDLWHEYFAAHDEIPLTGDFNGDGRDDIVTFTRGTTGDVHVALSNGQSFIETSMWNGNFSYATDIPAVGDFNGDGLSDIATFTSNSKGDVWVALSDGRGFETATKWHEFFAPHAEIPAIGDLNGDGTDDIATFLRGDSGKVYVAFSDGTKFVDDDLLWQKQFATHQQIPVVGDFNGDGLDDVASFTCGSKGNVYVSLSDGKQFQDSQRWDDDSCHGDEIPAVGDFNNDGAADIAVFTRDSLGNVWVVPSTGDSFGTARVWHPYFAPHSEIPVPGQVIWQA